MKHPDVQIFGEFKLEGAGKKEGTDGRADIIRVTPTGVYELYEIKPASGDPATPQLTKYLQALRQQNYNAILGTYPFSGQIENTPTVGVRITYDLEGPGEILYTPSINELGSTMVTLVAGMYTISQITNFQIGQLVSQVAGQASLQRGFLF